MNKGALIKQVAEKSGLTQKDAAAAVNAAFDVMAENMGEGITVQGFGVFGARVRKARKGLNPHTKEQVEIPASVGLFFKPSKALKDMWKDADIKE